MMRHLKLSWEQINSCHSAQHAYRCREAGGGPGFVVSNGDCNAEKPPDPCADSGGAALLSEDYVINLLAEPPRAAALGYIALFYIPIDEPWPKSYWPHSFRQQAKTNCASALNEGQRPHSIRNLASLVNRGCPHDKPRGLLIASNDALCALGSPKGGIINTEAYINGNDAPVRIVMLLPEF